VELYFYFPCVPAWREKGQFHLHIYSATTRRDYIILQKPRKYICRKSKVQEEQRIKKRLTPTEVKFCRRTAEYTIFDPKTNEDVLEELKVEPVDEKLRRYKSNWLHHVTRGNRMPKIMLSYRPNG
jgi:hypothetical protein